MDTLVYNSHFRLMHLKPSNKNSLLWLFWLVGGGKGLPISMPTGLHININKPKPRPLKHNSASLPSKAVQTHAKQCWLSSQARQCRHSSASPSTTVLAFIPGIAVQAQAHQCWLLFYARQCRHSSASPSTTVLAFIQGIAAQAQAHQCWLSSKA